MRTLTNFLLFETIYDNVPGLNPRIKGFADKVLSPRVPIVADDCNTRLGRVIALGELAVGKVSLLTYGEITYTTGGQSHSATINAGDILTGPTEEDRGQVTALLSQQNTVATRSVSTCTAKYTPAPETLPESYLFKPGTNGVCRQCIRGEEPEVFANIGDVPPVGGQYVVPPPTTGPRNRAFLSYLTDTHAGGLLGFKGLELAGDALLPVREEIIRDRVITGELSAIFREVAQISSVDPKYLQYYKEVDDKLEKALFLILMYGFFSNVKV